ncbi:hypothetical protein J7E70_02305 [Variovorax paradoxus]|nr:hypothetical protein [Variovorax paradoxus]MBT2299286.1 hypothetical protein [Variovorax paradoxus]
MDRPINYPGQVPLETDLLKTNQSVMVGLAKLCQAIFGTGGIATGFATTQTVVPSLAVLVAAGEIYSQQNLEATAVSSLPQDLTHSIVKQGILLDAVTLAVTPPGTAGFSINYLVQVAYQDSDTGSTVLPYYNASNPSVAYSGPANSGAAQPTMRQGLAVVTVKAGTAATTGTQTTPAPDAGKLGLYVVTVANGASTIVNANISLYASSPFLNFTLPQLRPGASNIQSFTSSGSWTVPAGVIRARMRVWGAGGGGGGTSNGGAAGGAGGGYAEGWFTVVPGTVYTVTVGTGGNAGTGAPTAGGAGGTTSVGALLSATGGAGGAAASGGTNAGPNAGQGVGTGGQLNLSGNGTNPGITVGAVPLGSAGGGTFCTSLVGGISAGSGNGNGFPGGGGGGAGGTTNAQGVIGAAGLAIIEW